MGNILDIIKNPGIIGKYINGVINAKVNNEQVYQLAFVKEADGMCTSTFLCGQVRTPIWPW